MGTINDKILQEVLNVKDLSSSNKEAIAVLGAKIDRIAELAERHERVLGKSNGNPGLIDRVEDIEAQHLEDEEGRKKREDNYNREIDARKKVLYGIVGSVFLVALDIVLHILGLV